MYLSLPAGIMQWCYSILVCSVDIGLMFFYQIGSDIQVSIAALSKMNMKTEKLTRAL